MKGGKGGAPGSVVSVPATTPAVVLDIVHTKPPPLCTMATFRPPAAGGMVPLHDVFRWPAPAVWYIPAGQLVHAPNDDAAPVNRSPAPQVACGRHAVSSRSLFAAAPAIRYWPAPQVVRLAVQLATVVRGPGKYRPDWHTVHVASSRCLTAAAPVVKKWPAAHEVDLSTHTAEVSVEALYLPSAHAWQDSSCVMDVPLSLSPGPHCGCALQVVPW